MPRYGVTRTLLGGEPDVNRRTIVDSWKSFSDVCVFNQEMTEWTAERERLLELVLAALNRDESEQ